MVLLVYSWFFMIFHGGSVGSMPTLPSCFAGSVRAVKVHNSEQIRDETVGG